MRISRIRKFKKSGEITIILTQDEATDLSFKLCHERRELIAASDVNSYYKGCVLGKELYFKGLNQLW